MAVTRRAFLEIVGTAAFGASTAGTAGAAQLPHPRGGTLGLELYSLRNELKNDFAGALRTARGWGFEQVELAGLPPMSADETARALRTAGLRAVSAFVDYDRFRDDFRAVVRDARTLGLEYVVCGWIPHEKELTRSDVARAVADFNAWGTAAGRENLRLAYHIHGYEFVASADGTLLDTLLTQTDPGKVDYEMDVFWVVRGGGDPVRLLTKYGARMRLVHLKDIDRGTPTGVTTGQAPDEASVAMGTGAIDWPAVMKSAVNAKVKWYFIEDEHPQAVRQIPQSLDFLRRLKI
jgi:sugar phosphate isomerase/epimerase